MHPSRNADDASRAQARPAAGGTNWLMWVFGLALVATVVVVVWNRAETEEIARIAERAQPWWLLLAVVLQAGTYLAQGQIWRVTAHAAHWVLKAREAAELSLAKLFVDQALPSAGLGSTAAVAQYLERRGMPRAAVMAGVVINTASYFVVYVALLVASLRLLDLPVRAQQVATLATIVFCVASLTLVVALLRVPGRPHERTAALVARIRPLHRLLDLVEGADRRIVHSPYLLITACGWQLAIVAFDTATVYVLLRALGSDPSAVAVFAGFMISNLFRAIGVLPGGLGTFEASLVLTLGAAGVPLTTALSATLLFRGLSFWLPMLPGAWCSRRVFGASAVAHDEEGPGIAYWSEPLDRLLERLGASTVGLTSDDAARRLARFGPNRLREERSMSRLRVLLRQFANPLLLLLVFAAVVAAITGQIVDAAIVLTILVASALIGFRREYAAHAAAARLRERIRIRTRVVRDGREQTVPLEEIVPGDVVLLAAGNLVPADARVVEARDAHVGEAVLTGESFPVEKSAGVVPHETPLSQRSNCVFMGTNVRSGTLRCVVAWTGSATYFGSIAQRLTLRPPITEFDRGVRRFGYMLTSAMLVMVLIVFSAHMIANRPVVETLLFSIALAVGLSPELLPAILSVNLARGASMMATHGVLVRHLNAIENLGSMDVLCTDKTGTLTEGVIDLEGGYDGTGAGSDAVIELGAVNAALETGLASPLDDAILAKRRPDLATIRKVAEVPFDFIRKRVSVVVERSGQTLLIAKGAFQNVLEVCTTLDDGQPIDDAARTRLLGLQSAWSARGIRVLAVATRVLAPQPAYGRQDEHDLALAGFLTFLDEPKQGAEQALADLAKLGVTVKLITGDAKLVAQHVAALIGMRHERVLTGAELDELHDEALWREAERTDLFVEVDPNQKERIILALRKMGHVVGFLGDGINDAPAMHAADTSLSVEQAVDVAREAADFVLLQRDLDVIRRGIEEGRRTFANTLKYVLTTMSANLGNMLSMAAASLFLPFLPLLAGQILLNNFLSDIPAVGIADDSVDAELVGRPRRWDMGFIGRFMVEFGLMSSLFDFVTFAVLLAGFHAVPDVFRTGWFIESLLTELVIAMVVRTRRPFYRSRPGNVLLGSTLLLIVATPLIPHLPGAHVLGFVPLPGVLTATLLAITAAYVVATEGLKHWFFRRNP